MSRKVSASTNRPLRKVRVLVGRARHQASALSSELKKLGAHVLEIPFIEIRKARSYQPLDSALKALGDYDWLILTSVNGVEAMWDRMEKLKLDNRDLWEGHEFTRAAMRTKSTPALAAGVGRLQIAAIGPATKRAIEQRGAKVDVVPKEYVAESVVRSLRHRVKGKRVLLVRAKVARDVIPRELRRAGARVEVAEAYETVVPQSSRTRLRAALKNPRQRPQVITFTSSSTVRNFVKLLGGSRAHVSLERILTASIGPVTSSTLRELGVGVDIEAKEFTIPGLVEAIVRVISARAKSTT
jgi:uroporphyrinogen-III synthase